MLGKEAMGWRATNKPHSLRDAGGPGRARLFSLRQPEPFGYLCPSCLRPVEKGQPLCAGCGRPLYVACPFCGKPTFVQERCEQCGQGLLVRCGNKRCGAAQFFENTRCTACGKKIKAKIGNR